MAQTSRNIEKHPFHAYVCRHVHERFEAYRRQLGLTSGSALLTLLVLREIELTRLGAATPRVQNGTPRNRKITTYVDPRKAEPFKRIAEQLGRSASDCAADLVERELEERWLEQVLKMPTPLEAAR